METNSATFEIKENILFIKIKQDACMDLEAVVEAVETRKKIQGQNKMLVLVDNRGIWQLTKEAQQYSTRKEVGELSLAMAIISGSFLPARLMANFFIKFNKVHCPTKLFKTEEKALEWLKTQTIK